MRQTTKVGGRPVIYTLDHFQEPPFIDIRFVLISRIKKNGSAYRNKLAKNRRVIEWVSQCGTQEIAISALVGHGWPVMTGNYTHLDDEQRAEAISGISKLIKFDTGAAL